MTRYMDFHPGGVTSISGVKGKGISLNNVNLITPAGTITLSIPANPGRKWLQISSLAESAVGVPYTGRFSVWFVFEAAGAIAMQLESGSTLLINEYTFPYCGEVWIITDASGNTGSIYTTEASVVW
jgi:hypothetical protein